MKSSTRTRLALPLLSLLLLVTVAVRDLKADVIYLHDGNVLLVEKAWIEGDEVKYQTSRGIRTLPKSSVREIQSENLPPAPTTPQRWSLGSVVTSTGAVPSTATDTAPPEGAEFSSEAIRRLRQNLSTNPTNAEARTELVRALNAVAWLQANQGNLAGARANLEEAVNLTGRDSMIVSNLAVVHLRMSNYRAAEDLLRRQLDVDRNNQEVHYLLGESYYGQDKVAQAIDEWNAGLRLGPHPEMSRSLDKAMKELRVHDQLNELLSNHFILRYDRKVSDQQLGQQILATLETLYTQLSVELTSRPPTTIAVILYPDQTFFDITRAASWSGAVFDGKIRVPTKGVTSMTPALRATLIHELTHAFIAGLPQDCPAWFNEGVAQLQEGESAAAYRKTLVQLQQTDRLIPLKDLEKSFSSLSEAAAEIAYAEGLSATEYMVSRHGKSSIRSILELMAQNTNFENAFQTTLKKSLPEFERAWRQDLAP
jgi:tetratricopeptide (TPR) repeat protein